MSFKHGVEISEVATSVSAPALATAGLPVVFGTAPVNLAADGVGLTNKAKLCSSFAEAVAAFGYSKDFAKYTLCEFLKSHFSLFAMKPVVLVNVLDPAVHKASVALEAMVLVDGKGICAQPGVLKSSVVVKNQAGDTTYVLDTDYTVAFDAETEKLVISRIVGGAIATATASLKVSYDHLDVSAVDATEIVGGVDVGTGAKSGLELLDEVFPKTGLVPGLVLAPKWSSDAAVAAVMLAKAGNINGHFKALCLVDISSTDADKYDEVLGAKGTNGFTDKRMVVFWPKLSLGGVQFHGSTQLAGLICSVDAENDDIPFVSPSNKGLKCDSAVLESGAEVWLGPDEAQYLNSQGIVTALNFTGGWKAWGNRTAAYPASTDVKDCFIPVRRMFDWIGNSILLTFWNKVDNPLNRRQIDSVVDSVNIWLNGLSARGALLGGRVEFQESENPTQNLMDGKAKFHVYLTPPSPNEEMDFVLEYDASYLSSLFSST